MAETFARKNDEGDAYWFLGGLYEVRVAGAETDDALTVMRVTVPAGTGSPPHRHAGGEVIEVLDGEVRCHIEGETVEMGAGATFHFPAGTLEWFEATTQATVLAVYQPGGIDRFFEEVGEHALTRTLPPPSDREPDFERIAAIAARHGLQIEPPG